MISEDSILEMLRSHAGIDAAQTGEASLRKEIRRAIDACQHPNRLLDTSTSEWKALLESSLVPETWFFRNMEAFDALAEWVAEKWCPAHPGACLRVLSLPCATGEEPYSIAMRLLEAGLAPGSFKVRAGDISEKSLATARAATYRRNSFRSGFDESRFGKFFESLPGGSRRISDEIREQVDFQTINLADPSAVLPQSDVIFCRNALIYFTGETQRAVVARLHAVLSDDGILFLGPVEPPVALQCGFATAGLPMAFACVKNAASVEQLPLPWTGTSRRPARPRHGSSPNGAGSNSPGQAPAPPWVKGKMTFSPEAGASRNQFKETPVRTPSKKLTAPSRKAEAGTLPVEAPADSLEAARALADSGEEALAAAMLDRLAPSAEPDFFCLRGIVSGALGRSDLAEKCYRKALYLDPSHHESLAHLTLLLEMDGREASHLRRRANKSPAQ
jgi:chemotaxis protein methyltransferase WspC